MPSTMGGSDQTDSSSGSMILTPPTPSRRQDNDGPANDTSTDSSEWVHCRADDAAGTEGAASPSESAPSTSAAAPPSAIATPAPDDATDSATPTDGTSGLDAAETIASESTLRSSSGSESSSTQDDATSGEASVNEEPLMVSSAEARSGARPSKEDLAVQCTIPSCTATATHFCVECRDLCTAHVPIAHSGSWAAHTAVTIDQKAAHEATHHQEKYAKKAREIKEKMKGAVGDFDDLLTKITTPTPIVETETMRSLDSAHAALLSFEQSCAAFCAEWRSSLAPLTEKREKLDQERVSLAREAQVARDETVAMQQLQTDDLLSRAVDSDQLPAKVASIKAAEHELSEKWASQPLTLCAGVVLALVTAIQSAPLPLSSSLSIAQMSKLQEMMPTISLSKASLVYRASRDGFKSEDFLRCCVEKGPTLTIIKAAGTGYLFGAYTAVSWPMPAADRTTVPDPSGTSFLFSLTNSYARPFRMSLVDRARAVSVYSSGSSGSFCFGSQVADPSDRSKTVKFCNLVMAKRAPTNEPRANFANHNSSTWAYQLDEWSGAPPGFKFDSGTLAGSHHFAAAEIDVYTLEAKA